MKIILHGLLAERFGVEHTIQTRVPADAIEGLSRQMVDWPRDMLVDVVGFSSEELLRSETDADEIHLMPAMHGGGGLGKIIIGLVVIAALIFLPPLGAAIEVVLISMSVSLIMTGISELMMKAPTVDKSNDPAASKYLGISRNTVDVGTFIPLAWGRVKLAGQWLSLQSNSDQLVTTSFPVSTT